MELRVWRSKDKYHPLYLLVYRDEKTGNLYLKYLNGNDYPYAKGVIKSFNTYYGGLWNHCRNMGNTVKEIRRNITAEIQKDKESLQEKELKIPAKQKLNIRPEHNDLLSDRTMDKISFMPDALLKNEESRINALRALKPGKYYVCVNFRKYGEIELCIRARNSKNRKVLGIVERNAAPTKKALLLFVNDVHKLYMSYVDIIGRTHAVISFGSKIVDSIPCIMEKRNLYYSTSAPRRFYDKKTLLWWMLKNIEDR